MVISTLDIILPCYNPSKNWEHKVVESYNAISQLLPGIKIGVILVNDGSSRNTGVESIDVLQKSIPHFQYITYTQNKGKGHALRMGVTHATAELMIYTDIDFPYTSQSFIEVFEVMSNSSCDIAAGVKSRNYYTGIPKARKYISLFLRFCSTRFLRLKISDTQCGLKGFNAKGKTIFLSTTINRYLFDLEFIYMASRGKQIHLRPVEVTLREGVIFSKVPFTILLTEAGNFLKIFLRSIFTR